MSDRAPVLTLEEVERRFNYHAPDEVTRDLHHLMRGHAKDFAEAITACLTPSRETSLFLTNLEQAMFWAHADIARNQTRRDE